MNKNILLVVICVIYIVSLFSKLPVIAKTSIEDKIACKAAAYNFVQTVGNSNCVIRVFDKQSKILLDASSKEKAKEITDIANKERIPAFKQCELNQFLQQYSDCISRFPSINELTPEEITRLKEVTYQSYTKHLEKLEKINK